MILVVIFDDGDGDDSENGDDDCDYDYDVMICDYDFVIKILWLRFCDYDVAFYFTDKKRSWKWFEICPGEIGRSFEDLWDQIKRW